MEGDIFSIEVNGSNHLGSKVRLPAEELMELMKHFNFCLVKVGWLVRDQRDKVCGRARGVGTIRGWGPPGGIEPVNNYDPSLAEGTVWVRLKTPIIHLVSITWLPGASLVKPAPSMPGHTMFLRLQATRMAFNLLSPTRLLPHRFISFPFDMEMIRQVQVPKATLRQSKPRLKLRACCLVSLVLPST